MKTKYDGMNDRKAVLRLNLGGETQGESDAQNLPKLW